MNNFNVKRISKELNENIISNMLFDNNYCIKSTDREEIILALNKLLSIFFPTRYANIDPKKICKRYIYRTLNSAVKILYKHILHIYSSQKKCASTTDCTDPKVKTKNVINHLLESLPTIKNQLILDIKTAFEGDPAASNFDEIILSYPFIEAIATHRIANLLYKKNISIIPRIMSEHAHSNTGIDINPGAEIGEGLFIDHGTGVVIGETCKIGKNVKIYQGVTLGAISPFDRKGNPKRGIQRHPTIESNVIIYANATILGGETVIGSNSIIGGNCWITKSVPQNSLVYINSDKESQIIKPLKPMQVDMD